MYCVVVVSYHVESFFFDTSDPPREKKVVSLLYPQPNIKYMSQREKKRKEVLQKHQHQNESA